jgi:hypothetical protein
MKDIGASVRAAYATLLSGITYNSKSVVFYDDEPFETVSDYHIVLTSIDQTNAGTLTSWAHDVVVTLDVVTKENMRNSRAAVDAISQLVTQALIGNYHKLVENADFQVHIFGASSPGYLHEQDGTVHINRKILRINNRLTQK